MSSFRNVIAGSIGALAAAVAGSAAGQTFYSTEVNGTLVDKNGVSTNFDVKKNLSLTPVNSSRGSLTFSVGASALSIDGGSVVSQTIMSPPIQVLAIGGGHAQFIAGVAAVSYTITFTSIGPGPHNDTLIPVEVAARGGAQWNNDGTAIAHFTVRNARSGSVLIDQLAEKQPPLDYNHGEDGFVYMQTVGFDPTQSYQVFMSASTAAYYSYIPTDAVDGLEETASVDPSFMVDPRFAARWSITGVPVSAPEASTWAMVLTGFAGLAFAASRSKAVARRNQFSTSHREREARRA